MTLGWARAGNGNFIEDSYYFPSSHIFAVMNFLVHSIIFHMVSSRACACEYPLGQTNLICCFSSAPASTSNTPLQLSLLPFASGTPPINAINNHVMSRETSLMASAHGHLNNEVMNNNRPPAPKFRKWLMRNNKSSLSGLIGVGSLLYRPC